MGGALQAWHRIFTKIAMSEILSNIALAIIFISIVGPLTFVLYLIVE